MHHLSPIRLGYRCECRLHAPGTLTGPALIDVLDATHPFQAVHWLKSAVRRLVPALMDGDPAQAEATRAWLTVGHWTTFDALRVNRPAAPLILHHGTTRLTWTAHPALYLSVERPCLTA